MTAVVQFILLKRRDSGIFFRQREAVDGAIRFANDSGKEGNPAVVLFQKSKFEKIWTYGESPYPPARLDLPMMMLGTAEPAKLADTSWLGDYLRVLRVIAVN
jgi:hypothetical protein